MNNIQIYCPFCDTALVVDVQTSGFLTACPRCKNQFEVPRSPQTRIGNALQARSCSLAYVSLVLVCLSLVTAGLLLLPGLICAHIAMNQCNRDQQMTGRSFAVAALVSGYIMVAVALFIIFGFLSVLSTVE